MSNSKVVRLSENIIDNLSRYYELLISRYGEDCPLVPSPDDYRMLLSSALIDAISYEEYLLND